MDFLPIAAFALGLLGMGVAVTYGIARFVPLAIFVTAQDHGRFAGLGQREATGRRIRICAPRPRRARRVATRSSA